MLYLSTCKSDTVIHREPCALSTLAVPIADQARRRKKQPRGLAEGSTAYAKDMNDPSML